ncbi:MAG: F0F1 ATP synthase subunit A [Planctomycetaceae bacterium]|nr:F0F1 ATP synthase subunit A [Planctomycetaceae bacterium]
MFRLPSLLAEHGTFHHVYDFQSFELPFYGEWHIPQPFAPYFVITKFMVLQVLAVLITLFIFRGLVSRVQGGRVASGWFWNFWEMLALYIRDEVVRPIIGDPHAHHGHDHEHPEHCETLQGHQHKLEDALYAEAKGLSSKAVLGGHPADKYLPFVWSSFFYILICNLLGAVPFLGSATGSLAVTGALAFVAFLATFIYGAQIHGWGGFWLALVPGIDAPGALKMMLVPMMFVIEVVGLFIKHGVLAVRLFANIMGGHTVLGVILGFIAQASHSGVWPVVMGGSVLGQIGVGLLELLVAFIQAYVFAFLSTIFIGMSLHEH